MAKDKLSVALPEKGDAFTRILRFMRFADVVLNAAEETVLDRWIYCDVLLRARRLDSDGIVADMVQRWGISKFTALSDINNTQKLFEKSRTISKKYLIQQHIEDIGRVIAENIGDKKMADLMPKLFDSYTKAIMALPDEQTADKKPPPIFQFILAPGQHLEAPMDPAEALRQADEILLSPNQDGVYE